MTTLSMPWVWIAADNDGEYATLVRADQVIAVSSGSGPDDRPGFEISVTLAGPSGDIDPIGCSVADGIASKEEAAAAAVELLRLVASLHAKGVAGVLRFDGTGWRFTQWDIP